MLNAATSDTGYEDGRVPRVFGFFDFSSFHRGSPIRPDGLAVHPPPE